MGLQASEEEPTKVGSDLDSGLTFSTYEANMKLARQILDTSKKTVATIGKKEAEGRKFNASRARSDVHAVTSRVASICESTELTESWVHKDLLKLADRVQEIHDLFHPSN